MKEVAAPSRAGVSGRYLQTVSPIQSYGGTLSSQGQGAGWFGPAAPMQPVAPADVVGRQFDYPVGVNLLTRPRAYATISFLELRALADAYDILRLAIETRKDQFARMSWVIKGRDAKVADASDGRIKALTAFFSRPDGVTGWADWIRSLLEDLFVIDAPALFAKRDRTGHLIGLLQIDGATIKPIIDDWGRTPQPLPIEAAATEHLLYEDYQQLEAEQGVNFTNDLMYPAAYQQILKGLPAVNYSARRLMYRPRNKRVHTPYGMSPVEQIVTTVNIALRRQLFTLDYFTEGTIPDSMIQVPKEWTPDQIASYQRAWDAYFDGSMARRRKVKFVPGVGANSVHETKQPDLKGDFDEWLAKLVCFAFSISPQALTKQMNRASAETQKELADEEGLQPIMLWVKNLIDDVIAVEFGSDDLEFAWAAGVQIDRAEQLKELTGYVAAGIMTRNEARDRLGFDPLNDPEASQAMVTVNTGVVPLAAYADQQERQATNARLLAERVAAAPTTPVDNNTTHLPGAQGHTPEPSGARQ